MGAAIASVRSAGGTFFICLLLHIHLQSRCVHALVVTLYALPWYQAAIASFSSLHTYLDLVGGSCLG